MAVDVACNASVDPRAKIDDDVAIGPFCVIGPDVTIERGTRLENNVTLMGRVTLGEGNHIFPGAVIGAEPQDISYQGGDTQVVIGDNNVIRESVTINRATEKDNGVTVIGSNCYLMAGSHVAHDCRVGDRVIVANGTMLGGHVHVYDDANISGACAVHHFTSIGSFSFVAGMSRVLQDVPPFILVEGSPSKPRCVNVVGLRRGGFSNELIADLQAAYRLIYRERIGLHRARQMLRDKGHLMPVVNHLLTFIEMQHEGRHGRGRDKRRAA